MRNHPTKFCQLIKGQQHPRPVIETTFDCRGDTAGRLLKNDNLEVAHSAIMHFEMTEFCDRVTRLHHSIQRRNQRVDLAFVNQATDFRGRALFAGGDCNCDAAGPR